jgi:hypothetical protein
VALRAQDALAGSAARQAAAHVASQEACDAAAVVTLRACKEGAASSQERMAELKAESEMWKSKLGLAK